ncbi:hypothetical protein [Jilunia laotingensis]|nr:hypothetical protein [Jilunia laotingensis]
MKILTYSTCFSLLRKGQRHRLSDITIGCYVDKKSLLFLLQSV